uniref:Uncharacterized protein STRF11 n=2 Tax=Catarrhini TaxID=9526 RepID=Q6EHZ1_HUMAN|nr:putative protein STRF11 [Homo sapiens]
MCTVCLIFIHKNESDSECFSQLTYRALNILRQVHRSESLKNSRPLWDLGKHYKCINPYSQFCA